MNIIENIIRLKREIPDKVKIVAVSKTMPVEIIRQAYLCGQRVFGENRVQELVLKKENLPKDIEWHFIGHLQSNKARLITPFISLIHSVDSQKLLNVINLEGYRLEKKIHCLLQIKIAEEETKYGMTMDEARKIILEYFSGQFQHVVIKGLMGMATFTEDHNQVKREFDTLTDFYKELKNEYSKNNSTFSELSMGMSGDYRVAIQAGSTMIRIGNLIFGERRK